MNFFVNWTKSESAPPFDGQSIVQTENMMERDEGSLQDPWFTPEYGTGGDGDHMLRVGWIGFF